MTDILTFETEVSLELEGPPPGAFATKFSCAAG